MNDALVYTDAAIMGAVAGLRSMSAPAVVTHLSESGLIPQDRSPVNWLYHPGVSKVLKVLATGEAVADKLPFIPSRTSPVPLGTRAFTGAVSGAAVCAVTKRPWWIGALIGAGAAVGASFGAYKLRKWATEEHKIPNVVMGVVEDAVVAGSSYLVVSSIKSAQKALKGV